MRLIKNTLLLIRNFIVNVYTISKEHNKRIESMRKALNP